MIMRKAIEKAGLEHKGYSLHSLRHTFATNMLNAGYFGDQFINFMTGREQGPDKGRHFGIAVDNKQQVQDTLV